MILQLRLLIPQGLAAAVYTQTTDVEIEVNGLLTYDRKMLKFPKEIAELHKLLYGEPPVVKTIVPTSEKSPQTWRYTTQQPEDDWMRPDFDDSGWSRGSAGFGANDPPGVKPRTRWNSEQIWIRRKVDVPQGKLANPMLRIYHDEDATVYLNGEKVATVPGYSTSYELVPLGAQVRKQFEAGQLVIAVHCKQTDGGQFIDLGLIDVVDSDQQSD